MKFMDMAAAAVAMKFSKGNCVTARVDELLFLAKDCLAGRKVLAVDLCGEPSANAPEVECSAASLVNQKLYGALAAKIED